MNVVVMRGTLSRDPEQRELPSGSQLVRYEVTIRSAEYGVETAPVVWLNAPANAAAMRDGDEVVVLGRVRRRWFRRGEVSESRIEVSADEVVAARKRSRSRVLLERATEVLTEAMVTSPATRRAR